MDPVEILMHWLAKNYSKLILLAVVLIVAQRVSTIMNAEQIIVLDDGKIVGKGTHKELLESNDIYKRLWQISEDSAAWNVVGTEGGAV